MRSVICTDLVTDLERARNRSVGGPFRPILGRRPTSVRPAVHAMGACANKAAEATKEQEEEVEEGAIARGDVSSLLTKTKASKKINLARTCDNDATATDDDDPGVDAFPYHHFLGTFTLDEERLAHNYLLWTKVSARARVPCARRRSPHAGPANPPPPLP